MMISQTLSQNDIQSRTLPLVSILIAQQCVLLPLYFFVPAWIILLNSIVALLVFYSTKNIEFSINRWIKLLITILAIAGVLIVFKKLTGKDAGVALITVMYGLKIMEVRTTRDANLLLNFGFFMLVAAFLFTQSPLMAVYQFIPIIMILNALLVMQSVERFSFFKKRLVNTFKELLAYLMLAIPIMFILFIFFPRLSGPIWRMPGSLKAVSGISDSMSPGEISNLQLLDEVAFRVKFESELPKESNLYWRALTLDHFDGIAWTRRQQPLITEPVKASDEVDKFDYSITLEPTQLEYLITLDRPLKVPKNGQLQQDFTTSTRYRILDRVRYSAQSAPDKLIGLKLTEKEKQRYTKLPSSGNPQSREWAQKQRNLVNSDWDYIHQLLLQINRQPYFYTLLPPVMDEDLVDSFWFDKRRGFCEHYAGAFVFLARAAGIPARVVIGYQGGEKNTLTDYWIIRYANAHAWTEVWIQDRGWVRVDPTGAIASSRVEQTLLNEYRQRESLFGDFEIVELDHLSWFKEFGYWVDQVNTRWNEWVLDYDSQRQRELFSGWGVSAISNQQLIGGMLFGVFLLVGFMSFQVFRQKPSLSKLALCFTLIQRQLVNQKVIQVDDSLGPLSLLRLLKKLNQTSVNKVQYQPVIDRLETYIQLQYSNIVVDEKSIQCLLNQVKQLKLKSTIK